MNTGNLNELNTILFDTLRGLKEGKIESEKAEVITKVSNSIISNAKAQISAVKLMKGVSFNSDLFGEVKAVAGASDTFEMKLNYAKSLGYKNIAEALSGEGKQVFNNGFKTWSK